MISQVAILSLTLIKYRTARLRGWDPVPIVALVVRDGIVIFAILISKTCALKIYCNTNRTNCILVVATLTVVATSTHNDYASIGNSYASFLPYHSVSDYLNHRWLVSITACAVSLIYHPKHLSYRLQNYRVVD